MKVRQDFTNNAAALDKALDQVKAENTQVEMDTESIILRNAYMEELIAEATIQQGGDAGAKSGTFSGDEGARQALVDIRRKANALHTLIRTMAGSPGKKVVLMATNRFSQYAGAEFYGNDMPSDKRVEFDTYDIRKQLAQAANAAGVTIYAIYPRGAEQVVFANVETRDRTEGMMVGPPGQTTYVGRNNERFLEDAKALGQSGKTLMNETAAIDQLAKDTGGVAAWGKTDIVRLTDAIRDDLGSYYSLAFRGSSSGKPHRLAIDTKNSSYSVRVRRDYIPQDDSVRMIERVRTSMYSRIDPPKVQFEVRTGAIKRNKKRFHIPVEVRIPMSELLAVPNENGKGSFSIYAATGGKLGALSDVVEKVQSFTLPATAPAADAVMTYKIEVIADGRADRLAIGVFDEGSKEWGVMNVRLELPDAKK
jgi:VWFA-related protein